MRHHHLASNTPSILVLRRRDIIVGMQKTFFARIGAFEDALVDVSGTLVVVIGMVTLGVED